METFGLLVSGWRPLQNKNVTSQKEGGSGASPHPDLLKRYTKIAVWRELLNRAKMNDLTAPCINI
jgi:hypothetical protein